MLRWVVVKGRLLPLAFLALVSGCRDEAVEVRRVPKEDAPPLPIAEAARPRGLRWPVPRGWTQKAGEGMRAATLLPAGGKAEVTVIALPGDVGGELANVNRWRGQIGLAPVGEAELASARASVASSAGEASVYDFTGDGGKSRMVAAAVPVDGTTWFFKLTGEAAAVAAAKPAFLGLLRGLAR